MLLRRLLPALIACSAVGCAALPSDRGADTRAFIELPADHGWFDGRPVLYVTTDVSDAGAAREMGVNHVPRLANALAPRNAAPGTPTAVEKIYRVTNHEQGTVLPSAPMPTGPANADPSYSPVWVLTLVTWQPGRTPRLLRSEEEVLGAAERGDVSVQPTRIVVNCPVVVTEQGGRLRNARLVFRRPE